MSTVARCNASFAALGAGLIHISMAAARADAASLALGMLGAAEILWAVLVLARARILVPLVALSVTAVAFGGFVLAVPAGLLRDPLPPLAAGLLQLVAAAVVIAALRRPETTERPVSASRALVGLLAGALAVSAVATPALASSSGGPGDMGGMMSSELPSHRH
ncbi:MULTISPECIES: hypothetical protein [unclassified Rathayibacter]|uniref:hypothetical protein n=1 Tax=unclassified Rathayibacter TaxID=2609250 RepID=UPI00188B3F1C|nr:MULTISPECIES: hypothetical protein [unclassified Rathayibacter]MBF4461400.1 hypothetical protein [Rathayibacter sp. VKM Ac-2879]MBF4502811.1 hypothetical protein [Rathayibacter sp. VKM Ac-2878]